MTLGLFILVLWGILTFAVFGIKGRVDNMAAELRRTNRLLARLAADAPGDAMLLPDIPKNYKWCPDCLVPLDEQKECPVCGRRAA